MGPMSYGATCFGDDIIISTNVWSTHTKHRWLGQMKVPHFQYFQFLMHLLVVRRDMSRPYLYVQRSERQLNIYECHFVSIEHRNTQHCAHLQRLDDVKDIGVIYQICNPCIHLRCAHFLTLSRHSVSRVPPS